MGGGIIGLEAAYALGSEIDVVEMFDQALSRLPTKTW
ncbi:hypothetical protein MJ579_05185 [Klebsiella pneumoniae]|nr:hypothetical protein MJ579_05185 [Klebsiella pneumoniae]